MTTVCLHVKPTASHPGMALMSVTLLGPQWVGERLRLRDPQALGLSHSDLVGWSDFYGGGPCAVRVARAASGRRTGYLVWGGTLGLRVVPAELTEIDGRQGDSFERRTVLWLQDGRSLPLQVRLVVEGEGEPRATPLLERAGPATTAG